MEAHELIADLKMRTLDYQARAENLKELPDNVLNNRTSDKSWSILECFEHLNRYGDFYLPEIEHRLQQASYSKNPVFTSGWLGNYFAKSLLPKEKLNKMKTFASMNPHGSQLKREVLDRFIEQQKQMIGLLAQAGLTDLNRVKTSISISKWIKLRLGDTFRVVIYHNERHVVQAEKVLAALRHVEAV